MINSLIEIQNLIGSRSLINRCEALMETRDKLSSHLAEMEFHINNETEAEALEKMNEEKMVKTLNYNVKLGCLL